MEKVEDFNSNGFLIKKIFVNFNFKKKIKIYKCNHAFEL